NPTDGPTAIASAAFHAVAVAHKMVVKEEIYFDANVVPYLCEQYLASFPNVWTLLLEQVETCPVRDDQVRAVFSRVRDSIASIISKDNKSKSNGLADIGATLKDMRLFVPSDAETADLEIPYITDSFGVGYVNMRLFEYAVHRLRETRGQPTVNLLENRAVAGDNFVAVSPLAYELLDITHTEGLLLNVPVVGTFIAQAIWRHVFRNASWKMSILSNINDLYHCPLAFEDSPPHQEVIEFAFIVPTLLMSVVTSKWYAKHPREWYREGSAPGLTHASYSRLFYLRLGDTLCDEYFNCGEALNTIVKYMLDFSYAFACRDHFNTSITDCKLPKL
ncbi:unnamed protein product, partial [Ixodes hexagonus]